MRKRNRRPQAPKASHRARPAEQGRPDHRLLELQRSGGNAAVLSLLQRYNGYSSSDEDSSMDAEVLLANANLIDWQTGVADGYDDGWYEGLDDERQALHPQPPYGTAVAAVGGPPAGAITNVQANPPADEYVILGEEEDAGYSHGYNLGYDDGSAETVRVLGWNRQRGYSAIPAGNRTNALAQNGGVCVYCNAAPSTQADHVYPVQKHYNTIGYTQLQATRSAQVNSADNLVGSCGPCNLAKSNRYLTAWVAMGTGGGPGQPSAAWGAMGAWFPHGPAGMAAIPAQRGAAATAATW